MSDWLDLELSHQLAPVVAPDGLWERIEQASPRPRARRMPRWPVFTLATASVAAATLLIAARAGSPDIRSSDPARISAWARERAGIDLSLPSKTPVELSGARLVRRNVVAVDYSVDGHAATLLVTRAGSVPDTPHGQFSWQSRGQLFALAYAGPGPRERACLLCHASL